MEPETMVAAVAQNTRLKTKLEAFVSIKPVKSLKMSMFGMPMKPIT